MLVIDSITKTYPGFTLGPISLEVTDEVLAILGPSGSGKTTLLSIIAGIVPPEAGTITLNGRSLNQQPPEDRGTVLVFQDGALFPHLTARQNIQYATTSPSRVDELAELLEITDILDQPAPTLSGGQRQRVALARSLAADPDALLLDEPLANLDTPIKRRLRDTMRDVFDTIGVPVIYVTHDQSAATVIGDRLAVVGDGEIYQVGTPKHVLQQPTTEFVASFTGNPNVFDATLTSPDSLQWRNHTLTLTSPHKHTPGNTVKFCIRPEYLQITQTPNGPNTILGNIATNRFEGDISHITLDINNGMDSLDVKLSPSISDSSHLDEGTEVFVSLPPEGIHILPSTAR